MAKTYTIPEFANALGVSRDTVERLIKRGTIKAAKKNPFGGRTSPLMIPASELARAKKLRDEQTKG
jgi:excisionase family DNA binding protein